jgi:hypothetical protein
MLSISLLLLVASAWAQKALPLGSGSVSVVVNGTSFKTGDSVLVSIGAPNMVGVNESTFHVVVRRCNAILQSTCSEQKYLEWRMQPFSVVPAVRVKTKETTKKCSTDSVLAGCGRGDSPHHGRVHI